MLAPKRPGQVAEPAEASELKAGIAGVTLRSERSRYRYRSSAQKPHAQTQGEP